MVSSVGAFCDRFEAARQILQPKDGLILRCGNMLVG